MNKAEIKRQLKIAGVKQKQIAEKCGVTPQFVNQVVSGKRTTISVVAAIADAIGRPVAEVFPDQESL
ncbi:MAG: helix-turn-helix transcriptional regulator [Rhodocyclaceae bacterium]|jgi:transcriptional regulator with XRE-family HTH domain|nr:helix-turn-helix transcriptional regulator [Rhodocyclaceae bacterium]